MDIKTSEDVSVIELFLYCAIAVVIILCVLFLPCFLENKKLCRNCKHFKSDSNMYNHTQGFCKQATITSAPFTADFISSKDAEPIKVWWNFGCVRFEKKIK